LANFAIRIVDGKVNAVWTGDHGKSRQVFASDLLNSTTTIREFWMD